jgi:hypothetical protein
MSPLDLRRLHPCGECRALVDAAEGCPHWRPLGARVGRPRGARNKVTRGHVANCLCAKCTSRRAPTVNDAIAEAVRDA